VTTERREQAELYYFARGAFVDTDWFTGVLVVATLTHKMRVMRISNSVGFNDLVDQLARCLSDGLVAR